MKPNPNLMPRYAVFVLTKNIKTGEQLFMDINDADEYFEAQVAQMKEAMRSCRVVLENRSCGYLVKELPLRVPSVIYELDRFNRTYGNRR